MCIFFFAVVREIGSCKIVTKQLKMSKNWKHIHVFHKILIFFCDLKTTTCYFFVLHLLSYILHNLFAICIIFGTYGVDFPNPLLPISIVQIYTLCTTYFQSLCTQATVFSSYLNYYSKRVFLLHDECGGIIGLGPSVLAKCIAVMQTDFSLSNSPSCHQ